MAHTSNCNNDVTNLLDDLRMVDTSSLCDADKTIRSSASFQDTNQEDINDSHSNSQEDIYTGLKLMNPQRIRPMNHHRLQHQHGPPTAATSTTATMAGVVRTVQCTQVDDFLPVLRGLMESQPNEVLVVNTSTSDVGSVSTTTTTTQTTKAVAGEIFATEASRRGLAGIIIDGPVRDVSNVQNLTTSIPMPTLTTMSQTSDSLHAPMRLPLRIYASSVTPYSGTIQSVGLMQVDSMACGDIYVSPGDIVVGDADGIVVGSYKTMQRLVPIAKSIQQTEQEIIQRLMSSTSSESLVDLTNYHEHVRHRLKNEESQLEFRL